MTTTRRRWPLAAATVLALAAGAGTLATADDRTPTSSAAAPSTAPDGYGTSSFTDCLDARGVPYTQEDTAEGRSLTPLGTDDPDIAADLEACSQLTSRLLGSDYTAYVNAVTTEIVDCLREDGYTIETDTDGNGETLEYSTVPNDLQQTSQAFREDSASCVSAAEMAIPSPAPAD